MESPWIAAGQPDPTGSRLELRILLAEDDDELRRALASLLRRAGCDVVEATSGTELLERVADNLLATDTLDYDLIVSDLHIEGWSGLDVIHGLRGSALAVPVLLMTAFGERAIHEQARALGAFVLDKPFDHEDFLVLALDAAMGERPTLVPEIPRPGGHGNAGEPRAP